MTFVAHVKEAGDDQTVATHLSEVAALAAEFAHKIGLPHAGELLGLLHDFGKYSKAFQDYILSAQGRIAPDADDYVDARAYKGKIDHSTAGAQYAWENLKHYGPAGQGELVAQIIALCIASHHSGLINCVNNAAENIFCTRMNKPDERSHLRECLANVETDLLAHISSLLTPNLVKNVFVPLKDKVDFTNAARNGSYTLGEAYHLALLTRFLFSCLVDADRLNSAEYENPERLTRRLARQQWYCWPLAIQRLESHLATFDCEQGINKLRGQISASCKQRAHQALNIYSLTVPTGGGKTLASLRYALHHAQRHGLQRIIYIIPFTSIIEQNAAEVRKILERDTDPHPWVLEHHSNLEPEHHTWHSKLVAENWDAPIVFTTMVQFLETLFSGGTRSVRRLHQLAKALLIFDEIQTLPVNCVHLFCGALNFLREQAQSSVLLCTATQPLLDQLRHPEKGQLSMAADPELMPDLNHLFAALNRVTVQRRVKVGGWSSEEITLLALERFQQFGSCLVIVNTKQWAQTLYQALEASVGKEALFHLSTSLYPLHRKQKLDGIRQRLQQGLPVLCISTQLIEAGVDVSFAAVIRFLAGLDSIAQAAGRCNRHGEMKNANGEPVKGLVDVINPNDENIGQLKAIEVGKSKTQRLFAEIDEDTSLLSPEVIQRYFHYYFFERGSEMDYPIENADQPAEQSLLKLLSNNPLNTNSENRVLRKGKIPLLTQQFMDAGALFKAIDAPTQALIVAHGEGANIVADLCRLAKDFEPKAYYARLKAAQQYSVNIFPHVWHTLQEAGAVYETQEGEGIYYLDERYYSEEFGVAVEAVSLMDNYAI